MFLTASVDLPARRGREVLSSLPERGFFDDRGDFLRMDDEGGMAAGDLLRLGVHLAANIFCTSGAMTLSFVLIT